MVRSSRNAGSQQSSHTVAGSSNPNLPNGDSREEDLGLLTEAQLDQRIKTARATTRLQRKRDYLTAFQRGEPTDINPFEFDNPPDEPVNLHPPTRRTRSETFAKVQLLVLKYKGNNFASLNNFLLELESRFILYPEELESDAECIVYVVSFLNGSIKLHWINYVFLEYGGIIKIITRDIMKEWLKTSISDALTWSLETVKKLHHMQ